MTWITDGSGTRWAPVAPRKRRRPARALRFGDVEPGAVLIGRWKSTSERHEAPIKPIANSNPIVETTEGRYFAVVTDRWFDPVEGETDRLKGEFVAVRIVGPNGFRGGKRRHTVRGLASQGFVYASTEQAARVRAFVEEREAIVAEWAAGRLTDAEARLRASPYRDLVRDL